jgi:hypothetical protein
MDELELSIDARVYCKNGKCGRLAKVVVNPEAWRVTHVVVEEGFLQRRSRVFPISVVQQATTGDVYLSVAEDELSAYPEYREVFVELLASEGIVWPEPENGPENISPPADPEKVRLDRSPELIVME